MNNKKLRCISDSLRKYSSMLFKEAIPHILLKNNKFIDLELEKMDKASIHDIISDILGGETIKGVPIVGEEGKGIAIGEFNINRDVDKDVADDLMYKLKLFDKSIKPLGENIRKLLFSYDKDTHSYVKYHPPVIVPEYTEKIPTSIKIAKNNVEYKYACTKVDLPKDLSKEIIQWGKENAPDDILFTEDDSQGREDDIHVTLFYGIKSDDPSDIKKLLKDIKPFEIRLGLINIFKNKDSHDVLKIEVESGELEKLHYNIRENIDNKNDFPTYEPHVTVSYIKKNSADHLIGHEKFKGRIFKANNISFSPSEGEDMILPLAK